MSARAAADRPAARAAAVAGKRGPARREESAPALDLDVQLGRGVSKWPVSRARLRRWCRLALAGPARIVLRLVGTTEGRSLNRRFRDRDHATNVLTFDYADDGTTVADIVLCLPVIRREAREAGRPLDAHLAHLVIHGLLHAQGYDHELDAEARTMERREVELLRRLRIADPYGAAPLPGDGARNGRA